MSLFPGAIASFLGFTAGHTLATDDHASQHNSEQAEIIAVQTKIGTGASTPTSGMVLRSNGVGSSAWGQVGLTTDVSGVLPQANGGTGRTDATGSGAPVYQTSPTISNPTITGGGSWAGSPTITTPTIASFTNANHNHENSAGGGTLNAANALQAGTVPFSSIAAGVLRLGLGTDSGATLTAGMVTHAQLTATSHGGVVELQWGAQVANGNSGADRNFTMQILCDGVATGITPATLNFDNPNITGVTTNLFYGFIHNQTGLAAGSHTWTLQFQASAGAAVVLSSNYLKVSEVV